MKAIGIVLLVLGAITFLVGFNIDTSVSTPIGRVNNIGLMSKQQNMIIFAGVLAIIGTIFTALAGKNRQNIPESGSMTRACPFCAETVKVEARICRFCQKELPPLPSVPVPSDTAQTETKLCPHCKTTIPTASDFCMACYKSL